MRFILSLALLLTIIAPLALAGGFRPRPDPKGCEAFERKVHGEAFLHCDQTPNVLTRSEFDCQEDYKRAKYAANEDCEFKPTDPWWF